MDFHETNEGKGFWARLQAARAEERFYSARNSRLAEEGLPRSSREREAAWAAWAGASDRAHQRQLELEGASRAFYAR